MSTADLIKQRAAAVLVNTTPHSIQGDIFVGDLNKLLDNIKAQMVGLLNDHNALNVKG
jgi:hypothetical protein